VASTRIGCGERRRSVVGLVVPILLVAMLALLPPTSSAGGVEIGPAGGVVQSGGLTLSIPAGALATPAQFTVAGAGGPDFDGEPPLRAYEVTVVDAVTNQPVGAFAKPAGVEISIEGLDLRGFEPSDVRIARLSGAGWDVLGRASGDADTVGATTGGPGTFAAVLSTSRSVHVDLTLDSNAPSIGRHRVDPGAEVTFTLTAGPAATVAAFGLAAEIPRGWEVVSPDGGAFDAASGLLSWGFGTVRGGVQPSRKYVLRAPLRSPEDNKPTTFSKFRARATYRGGGAEVGGVSILVAPRVVIDHVTLARISDPGFEASYLGPDQPLSGAQPYDRFRVRFQLRNADSIPVELSPQLEFRGGDGGYSPVVDDTLPGVPLYVVQEWRRLASGLSELGPKEEGVGSDEVRVRDTDEPGQELGPGFHSMGVNPGPPITLRQMSYTEVEFTVRVALDATFSSTYQLRLTDRGTEFRGAVTASVEIGPEPPLQLSPGQRNGEPVPDASGDSKRLAGGRDAAGPRYPLRAQRTVGAQLLAGTPVVGTHGPFGVVADQCATCHRAHTGVNRSILKSAAPQSTLCFTCHDGSGANTNVSADYTNPAVPANVPATRSYYRHDALVTSTHTMDNLNEFGGVSNRHSECGDCHDSHRANATNSTQTTSGWTASGRLASVSGVSVTNGAAGSSPTYTFLDGETAAPTREYQLCFKCHSGFTTLPSNTGFTPSRYVLDKGVELNPANPSYHPVEAAGKNTTQKMTDSLNGTSPYKLWTFTTSSTIRCSNCHASATRFSLATPPAAGASLPSHTSQYRGILLQNYRDRVLKSSAEAYTAADFALCYLCHGEAPFTASGGTAMTNFQRHSLHVARLAGKGSGGTDIDTAGAGQGNSLCAECHFRIHSTTYKVGTQALTGTKLVNFAPNVIANGSITWTSTGIGQGSCTLTCHGKSHNNQGY